MEKTNEELQKAQTDIETALDDRFCSKCGNEIFEGDKFCGKCGNKLKKDKKHKIKNLIIIFSIIIVLVVVIVVTLYLYGKNIKIGNITIKNPTTEFGITEKYLTKDLKEKGFEQFDDANVKILAITDIEYNNFNKLVLAKITATNNGIKLSNVGILLINRKNNIVDSFTINNNLIFLLNGLCNNSNNAKDIAPICAKYIKNYGTEILSNNDNDNFKKLVKEISNIVDVKQARNYVKEEYQKNYNGGLQYNLLFEKDSALIKYIAFYTETLQYNSSYPIDERMYKYLAKDYSNRKNLNALEYAYGPAYTSVKQYEVWGFSKNSDTKVVGTYKTLEAAKSKLNVEE